MIQITDLSKNFGAQILFEEVTLQLNPGYRYGLVGANGSGKTTFLKILAGDEHEGGGTISYAKTLRFGVLRQDRFVADDQRIVDCAMQGDAEVFAAIREQERLAHEPEPDAARLVELNDFIAHQGGYTLEARARETLLGLGLTAASLDQPLGTLSGGYKLRVLLAQVLVGRPDVMLLDEPTNHLDILSIRWLERFLQAYSGCAVIISHDRGFLDSVANRILDVDYETILDYPGNYTQFLGLKTATRERMEVENARAEKSLAEKKAFVERFRAKATKARQAQSRMKQIEKIEITDLPRSSRQAPRFRFEQERQSGRDVLTVEALHKSYGDKRVLDGVDFVVRRGERVAIIGANGIGKSTLLKILAEKIKSDTGAFTWGHQVKLGYFAQDHRDLLDSPRMTPLQFVWDAVPQETTSYVRGQLGRMLFSGDDVEKSVVALSGGEAARVIFARLSVEKPNVLMLDEPTNHLDIETIDALGDALLAYEGTLLFVSHDRYFVQRLATRVIELRAEGITDFPGTYDEYLARDGDDHLNADEVELRAKVEKRKSLPPTDARASREERKKRQAQLRMLTKKRDELLATVEQAEGQKAEITKNYDDPQFFQRTSTAELKRLDGEQKRIEARISELMSEWEAVEESLSALEAEEAAPLSN